ncbi:MAG: hypothetical protein KF850_21975 [Labilithrix sp.]|nr:hypothetical protein [Labilithrix sp.]
MPALRGSLTYARFFVEGELPDDFRERFMRAVRLRAMRPLEPTREGSAGDGRRSTSGSIVDHLTYDDVFFNSLRVVLGFRTDRWAIRAPVPPDAV